MVDLVLELESELACDLFKVAVLGACELFAGAVLGTCDSLSLDKFSIKAEVRSKVQVGWLVGSKGNGVTVLVA